MKRQRRERYQGADYPSPVDSNLDRRRVLTGLGCLVGGLTLVPYTTGCWSGVGQELERRDNWDVRLPLDPANRSLYFSDGADIDYHVDVTVFNEELAFYLEDGADSLLALIDEALLGYEGAQFAPDEPLGHIQNSVESVLSNEWYNAGGDPDEDLYTVSLTVDVYNEEEDWAGGEP